MGAVALAAWLAAAWLLGWLLLSVWRTARMLWLSRSMPGLPPFRLVLRCAVGLSGPPTAMLTRIMRGYRQYGSPWRLWFGPFLAVFLREPDDVKEIIVNPATQDKPGLYQSFSAIFGPGLVTIGGEDFRRHRKALAPSFHIDVLRSLIPLFNDTAEDLCQEFELRAKSGEVFDSAESFKRVTTDAVLESFLCCDKNGLREHRLKIVQLVSQINEIMMYFVQRPWFWNRTVRRLWPCYSGYADLVNYIDQLAKTAVEMKLRAMQQPQQLGGDTVQVQYHRKALLDYVVTSANFRALSQEELESELKHVCSAALGTTSDLLSFLALALAKHPEVQDRLYEELTEVFAGDETRGVTHADLERLEYLERVLLEVLRWFPAVPALARHAAEDVKLPSGCVIPKGAIAIVILRAVHMNSRHHTDPYAFNPDRFLPENFAAVPKYAYLPFSDGNRACPGKRWGMIYTKVLAATFLRRFRVLPDPNCHRSLKEVETVLGISLQPVGGARVRVERRLPPAPSVASSRGC